MNAIKNTGRLPWLDRVKGIGIVFVVIGHVYVEDGFLSRIIHGLNVPLFFIGAGYLSAYKQEGRNKMPQLLAKKVRLILRPYFIYSAAVMVWLCIRLLVFGYGSHAEILHCLADIFCLEGISSLWFLSVLFLGEMLYLFCGKQAGHGETECRETECRETECKKTEYRETKKTKNAKSIRKKTVVLFVLLVTAYLLTCFLDNAENFRELFIGKIILKFTRILTRAVMAAGLMMLGDILYSLEKRLTSKNAEDMIFSITALICLLLSSAGLWYNGLRDFHYLSFGNFPLYVINTLFGFIAAASIGRLLKKDQILVFFGQNSLWIMATHLILLDFINIMAVILSAPAGRYLGDASGAKLAVLTAAELLLLWGRKKNPTKNNPKI